MKIVKPSKTAQLPVQFSPGQIVATPGALRLLAQHFIPSLQLVGKHIRGEFRTIPHEDAELNRSAIKHGDGRILSSYPVGDDRVWIITEHDKYLTTLLLPEEY